MLKAPSTRFVPSKTARAVISADPASWDRAWSNTCSNLARPGFLLFVQFLSSRSSWQADRIAMLKAPSTRVVPSRQLELSCYSCHAFGSGSRNWHALGKSSDRVPFLGRQQVGRSNNSCQMRMTQLSELVGEPCACGLPLMWMWQIGSPVARGSVACADAALSGARFASVAGPGLARSQNRALPFRSMAHQIRAQRLSQISSHASWTVWAGSSVHSEECRTWL
ncbi:unnamed protein product [Effrenium voratum]|uniref:Uncharacterized protein n=1 Tax=Effrenium voratum TaxID=2562239 RepID=A0AA36MQ94_9DINO|nr:unnamed protein product [Effrenium voratum]CAJ1418997.1 unnamed protein product [Effrenium voratum]